MFETLNDFKDIRLFENSSFKFSNLFKNASVKINDSNS